MMAFQRSHTVLFVSASVYIKKWNTRRYLLQPIEMANRLKPEPDNPYDNNAVAFICQTNENAEWKRIGYVVKEVASEILGVINAKNVLNVKFAWIKYLSYYKSRGWYTGIMITRSGEWSQQVLLSRATDYD